MLAVKIIQPLLLLQQLLTAVLLWLSWKSEQIKILSNDTSNKISMTCWSTFINDISLKNSLNFALIKCFSFHSK